MRRAYLGELLLRALKKLGRRHGRSDSFRELATESFAIQHEVQALLDTVQHRLLEIGYRHTRGIAHTGTTVDIATAYIMRRHAATDLLLRLETLATVRAQHQGGE